jgi:hypothetical protein
MKFINYGIPTGLGISEFNTTYHKHSNPNGITNKDIKNTLGKIQIGGGNHNISYSPCETVFYVIEHPINITKSETENKKENDYVKLTDDEELSEEIEFSTIENETSELTDDEELSEELSEEIELSTIENETSELTDDEELSEEIELSTIENKNKKARALKDIFSHDTLSSILNELNDSNNSKNTT